jgi:hypothetical protein
MGNTIFVGPAQMSNCHPKWKMNLPAKVIDNMHFQLIDNTNIPAFIFVNLIKSLFLLT